MWHLWWRNLAYVASPPYIIMFLIYCYAFFFRVEFLGYGSWRGSRCSPVAFASLLFGPRNEPHSYHRHRAGQGRKRGTKCKTGQKLPFFEGQVPRFKPFPALTAAACWLGLTGLLAVLLALLAPIIASPSRYVVINFEHQFSKPQGSEHAN